MPRRLVSALSTLLVAPALAVGVGVAASPPASAATAIIPVPTSAAGLGRIVASPDGNVWFAETDANKVGRISPSGQVVEIPFPARFPGTSQLMDLDVAPDGTVWVVYESGRRVRHIDANGTTIADGSLGQYPYGEQVRVAPDGTVWVTMSYDEQFVVRIVGTTIYRSQNAPPCADSWARPPTGRCGVAPPPA